MPRSMSQTFDTSRYANDYPASLTTTDRALVWASLLYLFSGFYKEYIPSPVDLTLVWIIPILVLSYLSASRWQFRATPLAVASIVMVAYVILRWAVNPTTLGTHRMLSMAVLGFPAVCAGIAIAISPAARQELTRAWAILGAVFSVVLVIMSARNPNTFTSLGSGGYQLTGFFIAGSAVCAAIGVKRFLALTALGALVTGHVTAALFGAVSVLLVLVSTRDWKTLVREGLLLVVLLAGYVAVVGVPIGIQRVGYKAVASNAVIESAVEAKPVQQSPVSPKVVSPKAADTVDTSSADRLGMWKHGLSEWLRCPVFGCGVGAVDYGVNRYAHNIVVEFLADTGLVGAILLFVVLGLAFWYCRAEPLALGLLSLTVLAAMVSGEFGGRIFMLVLGVAIGTSIIPIRRSYSRESFMRRFSY